MKKTQIVATLAFAFMLGIAMPITQLFNSKSASAMSISEPTASTIVSGISTLAEYDSVATSEVVLVGTEADLKSQVKQSSDVINVKLTSNIEITGTLSIVGPKSVTIDLGGHNITSTIDSDVFNIWGADVTFTGTGTISASGKSTYSVVGIYEGNAYGSGVNHVVIDEGVTVESQGNKYAIGIVKQTQNNNSHRSTLELYGKVQGGAGISINGTLKDADKAPAITIGDSAEISSSSVGIYAAGLGTWTIDGATIEAATPIAAKAGSFTVNDATITATGTYKTNPETQGNGIDATGVVFQIEHNQSYADNISIAVNGGTYASKNGAVFYEYGLPEGQPTEKLTQAKIGITSGTFSAASECAVFAGDTEQMNVTISGGRFTGTDVADFADNGYLADGVVLNPNGTVTTPRPSTSPSTPATSILSDGDASVEGTFPAGVTFEAKVADPDNATFQGLPHAIYDLNLLNADGSKYDLQGPAVRVTLKVPASIDGTRSHVYYLNTDGKPEQLDSTYVNGKISFTTTHFSLYAIVEDMDEFGHLVPGAEHIVPNTGLVGNRGVIGAVSTIAPLVVAAGFACMFFSGKIHERSRQRRLAALENEMDAEVEQIIDESEPEPVLDHFIAVPIDRDEPTITPVDPFIPRR